MKKQLIILLMLLCLLVVGCQQGVRDENPVEDNLIGSESDEGMDADKDHFEANDVIPATIEEKIEATLEAMSLEEKVGQLFIVDLNTLNQGSVVTEFDDILTTWLTSFPVGGVIFFSDNIVTIDQTTTLIQDLQESVEISPFYISG